MAEELSVVGKSVPRYSARNKVTGKLKYYSDQNLPGMLYMRILRSPHAHAKIKAIDTSRAEAMNGVEAIITHEDVPNIPMMEPESVKILDDKVYYVGCEVAAVAAVSEEIAEEATRLIDVEYEVLPVLVDPEEAIKPDAPEIHPGTPNLVYGVPLLIERGDVDAGLAEADYITEGSYTIQRQAIAAMENHGVIANWDPNGDLTLWLGTQASFPIRTLFSQVLGLPVHKIRVIHLHMGGGFGGKQRTMRHIGMAALLSKKTVKPVKFVGSKEDEFIRMNHRPSYKFHIKTGVKKDGAITAIHVKAIQNGGAYNAYGAAWIATLGIELYPCPNMYFEVSCAFTNWPTAGAFRGIGAVEGISMSESHFDIVAERLGMDPIEFRRKNHIRSEEMHGWGTPVSSCELGKCITVGAEAIGWQEKWQGYGQPYLVNGSKRRAVGIAIACQAGSYGNKSAMVKVMEDGTVQLFTGVSDVGQGSDTVLAQICAEALKVRYEDVAVVSADTATTPWCTETSACSGTCTGGNAVKLAAEHALIQLFEAAAPVLEVKPEDLDAEDGIVFIKGAPETKISYADVMISMTIPVIVGFGSWQDPMYWHHGIYGFAAQFADVEVDMETGEVKLLKMVTGLDAGTPVNPNTLKNMALGGIAGQGIGAAMTEDFYLDETTGKALNPNYIGYGVPTMADVPELEAILVESFEPLGPFGAKGASEVGSDATSPAIANAVYNAIGKRITEYPISPDKVLKALGKI